MYDRYIEEAMTNGEDAKREEEYAQKCRLMLLSQLKSLDLSPEYQPADKRTVQISALAMEEKPWRQPKRWEKDNPLKEYIDRRAYCAITCQGMWWEKALPRIEKRLFIWEVIQAILFLILAFGIIPNAIDPDIKLSRELIWFLFLAFVGVSVWCRRYSNFYNQRRKDSLVIIKGISGQDIAVYMCSPRFATGMRREIAGEDGKSHPYYKEIADYLDWYERVGKKKYEDFIKSAIYYTGESDS